MANPRRNHRTDLFILEDPNKSRYSKRLTQHEWQYMRPTISGLFFQDVSVAEILRQLRVEFGSLHITRSQLETQMRKWELTKETRESDQLALHSEPNIKDPVGEPETREHSSSNSTSILSVQASQSSTLPAIDQLTSITSDTQPTKLIYTPFWLPPYKFTTTVRNLPWPDPTKPGQLLERLSAFAHTALLLANLMCFNEAFEIWFLITSVLNDAVLADQLWGPQMVFLAMICAHAAKGVEQHQVGVQLVRQVRSLRDKFFGHASQFSSGTGQATGMRNLLSWAEHLIVEDPRMPDYWAIFQYSNSVILTPCAAMCGEQKLWSKDVLTWPLLCRETLYASGQIKQLMLETMSIIQSCLAEESNEEIDERLGNYWPPNEHTSTGLAQALACLVLEYHAREYQRQTPKPADGAEMNIQLKGQALAVLPFVVVHWVHKLDRPTNAVKRIWPRCSHGLYFAAKAIRQALGPHPTTTFADLSRPSFTNYEAFINLYLIQLGRRETNMRQPTTILEARLVRAAAATAGISMLESYGSETVLEPIDELDECHSHSSGLHKTDHQARPERNERHSTSSSLLGLAVARSYRSSMSSAYRSFKGLSIRIRDNVSKSNLSVRTDSMSMASSHMSWQSGSITGFFSGSLIRNSTTSDAMVVDIEESTSSDALMGGVENEPEDVGAAL